MQCTFKTQVNHVGFMLEELQSSLDIPEGTTAQLPFWLAKPLVEQDYITAGLPAAFSPKTRTSISVNPSVVDIHSLCPHYYRFGCKLIGSRQGVHGLAESLSALYLQRAQFVLDQAQHSDAIAHENLVKVLDESERDLLSLEQQSTARQRKWHGKAASKLDTADVLKKHKRVVADSL